MKKKIFAGVLAGAMALSLVACGQAGTVPTENPDVNAAVDETVNKIDEALNELAEDLSSVGEDTTSTDETTTDDAASGVMTYADYVAAELDSEVTVDCYVQDCQSWWDNKITVYAADEDGAYFIYNMACTEEQAQDVIGGAHIRVTGYKTEWEGEVEIADATFEKVDDETFFATPVDVTAALGTEEIADYMNQLVTFTGLKVAPSIDADGNEAAFLYSWNGSGTQGDDVYFNVEDANGNVYQFCIESYLRGAETDVYQAAEALEIGQEINCEGFLYWYGGINPHIIEIYDL